jgi:hypothetical protein
MAVAKISDVDVRNSIEDLFDDVAEVTSVVADEVTYNRFLKLANKASKTGVVRERDLVSAQALLDLTIRKISDNYYARTTHSEVFMLGHLLFDWPALSGQQSDSFLKTRQFIDDYDRDLESMKNVWRAVLEQCNWIPTEDRILNIWMPYDLKPKDVTDEFIFDRDALTIHSKKYLYDPNESINGFVQFEGFLFRKYGSYVVFPDDRVFYID